MKYIVLSIKQLKQMVQVAEQLSTEAGLTHTDQDCMIYGAQISGQQITIRSVRNVAQTRHYVPGNILLGEDSPLISYSGEFEVRAKS